MIKAIVWGAIAYTSFSCSMDKFKRYDAWHPLDYNRHSWQQAQEVGSFLYALMQGKLALLEKDNNQYIHFQDIIDQSSNHKLEMPVACLLINTICKTFDDELGFGSVSEQYENNNYKKAYQDNLKKFRSFTLNIDLTQLEDEKTKKMLSQNRTVLIKAFRFHRKKDIALACKHKIALEQVGIKVKKQEKGSCLVS